MIRFCSLYSGSSGNSLYVKYKNTGFLIDAGMSGIRITEALRSINEPIEDVKAILVSHEHKDHIMGVGVLSRRYDIPVYANNMTWNAMHDYIGSINAANIKTFETKTEFFINNIKIKTFKTYHDAAEPVGFCINANNKKVVVLTDTGCITSEMVCHIENSDFIFIESNHDENILKKGRYPYWLKQRILSSKGHLCNNTAAKTIAYLAKKGTRKFMLGHLSRENNYPELAYKTAEDELKKNNIDFKKEIFLEIALRDKTGKQVLV